MSKEYEPMYSGPNRTGICVCGHHWSQHHLGCVMNEEYFKETGESYVPQECEHYGFNENGGMMPNPDDPDGPWIDHCGQYRDSALKEQDNE